MTLGTVWYQSSPLLPPPQTGPNSFVFAKVFAQKHPRRTPPQRGPPPQREILGSAPEKHLIMLNTPL